MSDEKAATNVIEGEIVQRSVTPMELIQVAMNQNADVDRLEKLMELQLRWEANEAKKAFVAAMNAFKTDPPEVLKNKHVSYANKGGGTTEYDHATLDHTCDQITGALSKQGISHRWKVSQSDGVINVTCVLTHCMGHSEETTLSGAHDLSGGKNAIQAIGSTVSYLERYTLLAATGLAAANGDDDGRGHAQAWDKLQEFLDSIATAPNLKVLEDTFKGAYKEATAAKAPKALLALIEAKNARKRQLASEAQ